MTILLGSNDAAGGRFEAGPVSVSVYADAMEALVDRLLADGAESIVLMSPPHRPRGTAEMDARLRGYGDAVAKLCGSVDAVVCGPDLYDLLDPTLDFDDRNIHPNAQGHSKIGLAPGPVILCVVPEPETFTIFGFGLLLLSIYRRRRN